MLINKSTTIKAIRFRLPTVRNKQSNSFEEENFYQRIIWYKIDYKTFKEV